MKIEPKILEWTELFLDPAILWSMVQLAFVAFLMLSAKNAIANWIAWIRFRMSLDISVGTWVSVSTPAGFIDGCIVDANMSRIIVESDDLKVYIPTRTFPDRDWVILKRGMLVKDDTQEAERRDQ